MKIEDIAAAHPKYLWGGASNLKKGLDCSGSMYLAAKWAGIVGPRRTRSCRMAQGLDGWTSDPVLMTMATDCDLTFFTWENTPWKVNSHTGALLTGEPQGGRGVEGLALAHAGSKGFGIVPFRGVFVRDLSIIRRLR
jgi:hypothetical protein